MGLIQARREGVDPSAFAWTFEQVGRAKFTRVFVLGLGFGTIWVTLAGMFAIWEQVLLAKVDGEVVRQQRVAKRMVKLHVYHVSLGGFVKGLNLVLPKKVLGGVYHAGVEIDGNEWSYGFRDTDETGVTPW